MYWGKTEAAEAVGAVGAAEAAVRQEQQTFAKPRGWYVHDRVRSNWSSGSNTPA